MKKVLFFLPILLGFACGVDPLARIPEIYTEIYAEDSDAALKEKPKTSKDEAKPAKEEDKPSKEESKPAKEEAKPSKEESKPAKEEAKPSKEEAKPAKEENKPSKEESKPAGEESKEKADAEEPIQEESEPSDESESPEDSGPSITEFSLDNVQIIQKKSTAKADTSRKQYVPYIASLPYYCDPSKYPPNIILTAGVCRPFLDAYTLQGYLINRGYDR